jgi:hypothetical protein
MVLRFWKRKDDNRSRRAVKQDKARQAAKTYPRTPWGIMMWSKNKAHSDLRGYDTSYQTRLADAWERHKPRKYTHEKIASDLVDWHALEDSTLSASENRDNIRRQMRDFMRI